MSFKESFFDVPPGSERLASEIPEVESGIHHTSNLYDQNEDSAGETTDLATGEPIDNSTYNPDAELTTLDTVPEGRKTREERAMEKDDAADWLRDNDPDYKA